MITRELGYSGDWLLGDAMDDVAAQALKESSGTPSASAQAGQPSYGSGSSGSGGGFLDSIGKYAGQAGKLADAGKGIISKITGKSSGGTSTTGKVTVCKKLYTAAKAFIAVPANQAKYKSLVTAQIAGTAWQTYKTENLACGTKYTSGGFGAVKKGDASVATKSGAFAKYNACTKTAMTKYKAAGSASNLAFVGTFRDCTDYVSAIDRNAALGRTVVESTCTSPSEKNLLARITSAGTTTSTYVIGALVLVAAGAAAYYLL
jgi:hypothetical protein